MLGLCIAASGCKPRNVELAPELLEDAGDGEPIDGLESLEITPASSEATFDGKVLDRALAFRAMGKFPSGKRDVTEQVDWSLSRPELGSIVKGKFVAGIGGSSDVIASAGGITGTAKLTIRLDVKIAQGLPDAVVRAFDKSESDDRKTAMGPQISYPATDTQIPSNLTHVRYQWHAADAFDAFELRIDSSVGRVRYFTHDRNWLDSVVSSRFLAPSHPGEQVKIHVRALEQSAPDVIYRSDDVTVQVVDLAVRGDAYYWSSTAQGIKRGSLAVDHASRVVTDPKGPAARTCTGCHALSRDGKHLAVADGMDHLLLFTEPESTQQTLADMPPPPPPGMMPMAGGPAPKMPMAGAPAMMMPMAGGPAPPSPPMAAGTMAPPTPPAPMSGMPRPPADYGWSSFSPDGSQLAYAAKGKLHLLTTATGAEVPKVKMGPDMSVTHPDWSPDGSYIAVTLTMGKPAKSEKLVKGSSIARMRVQEDGMLGDPEPLVSSTGADDTLAFPVYSPDGHWIAFSRAMGSSKDNPTAQLWIVSADGGTPILLTRASRPSGTDSMSQPAAANTMPVWAPAPPDSSNAFLTFSSTRDYGDVLVRLQRDQIWASAIDFDVAAMGTDPSAPAFWLPFQDPTERNHRALWASDMPNETCSTQEVCDDRDDDCDGIVDESCCPPSPSGEDCSTDADDDCDGVANEGCDCEDVDICGNGLDEDCDQHTDEDCMP